MIDLQAYAVARQPHYLTVFRSCGLDPRGIGLSPATWGSVIYLVSIGEGDLNDPQSDVIQVIGDGCGNRLYTWRHNQWREGDLSLIRRQAPPRLRIPPSLLEDYSGEPCATSLCRALYLDQVDRRGVIWQPGQY